MDNIISWKAEDEAIIATNTEATECKRSAVELGYWKDDYIQYFAKRVDRKPPEINRGYYARVKAMEMFIHQFLERCDTKCQIINLGCGFDTLYWRLKDTTQAVGNFIEIDFPAVTTKKCHIIKRNKQLLEKISNEDGEVIIREGDLHSDGYHLLGCDLACLPELRRKLAGAGAWGAGGAGAGAGGAGAGAAGAGATATADAPTLVLAECVLVYLRAEAAAALVRSLAGCFGRSALVVYEQCNLGDRFGEVMARSLEARGCGAPGAAHRRSPPQQAECMRALGWERARAWDMRTVWGALGEEDRARAEALEPLDERELLHQLNAHYALTVATRSDLFADMDLNA